nr:MAG TPA: hypothetical protein [Caudoviricetes sp.]
MERSRDPSFFFENLSSKTIYKLVRESYDNIINKPPTN